MRSEVEKRVKDQGKILQAKEVLFLLQNNIAQVVSTKQEIALAIRNLSGVKE